MAPAESARLRRAYAEICRGYSESVLGGKPVFIKHLNVFDQTEIDIVYDEAFNDAKGRGIGTEEERLAFLEKRGIWTKKNELELHQDRGYVETLKKTRSKAPFELQIKQLTQQIEEAEVKINKTLARKNRLLGLTAEKIADQKVQFEYLRLSVFNDRKLESPKYSRQDVLNLLDYEANEALSIYIQATETFGGKTIRQIAVQPFFTSTLYLCGDRLDSFFGKPLIDLTFYQSNLLGFGQYYKNIMSHNEIPPEMLDDPDKVEGFVNHSKNAKSVIEKASVSQNGRVGLVGGTQRDFQAIGVKDSTNEMREVAAKQYKTGREGAQDLGVTWT